MSAGRPFAHAISPEHHFAYVRMWGRVTGSEMREAGAALHHDPAWEDGFDALWDCSAVSGHIVDVADVKPLVDEEVASGSGRDAFVTSATVGDSEITEMLAAYCRRRGKRATVHGTVEEGLAALGRDALPAPLAALRT